MSLEKDITEIKKKIDRRVPVKTEFTKEEDPTGLVAAAHDPKNVRLVWWYNPKTAEFKKTATPTALHGDDIDASIPMKETPSWVRGRVFEVSGRYYLIVYHPDKKGITNTQLWDIYDKATGSVNKPITRVIDGWGKNIGDALDSFGIREIEHSKLGGWRINESGVVVEAKPIFKAATPEQVASRPEPADRKTFKVAAVSSNTNSFGLHNVVLVARDGETWSVGANMYNTPKKGMTYTPNRSEDGYDWTAGWGFEIPHRLQPDAPPEVVREVWGT